MIIITLHLLYYSEIKYYLTPPEMIKRNTPPSIKQYRIVKIYIEVYINKIFGEDKNNIKESCDELKKKIFY